jgi:hypothetical protein
MIGWGTGLCCVTLLGVKFLHTIGWSEWPMTEYLMISRCAEILKESHLCAASVNVGAP